MVINDIKDFGPIVKNNIPIEIKDLTIFMGDNSSGKTLLGTLLYKQFHHIMLQGNITSDMVSTEFHKNFEKLSFYKSYNLSLKTVKREKNLVSFKVSDLNEEDFVILKDFHIEIIARLNRYIVQADYSDLIGLNYSLSLTERLLSISNLDDSEFSVRFEDDNYVVESPDYTMILKPDELDKEFILFIITSILDEILIDELHSNVCYLPSSRTGLIRALDTLIGNYKNDKHLYISEQQFLDDYLLKSNEEIEPDFQNIIKYIEEEILNGHIILDKETGIPSFEIKNKKVLPTHYSSSLTELMPLIVFIKKGKIKKDSFLFIDEPESHLTLKNQKLYANVIAKLVNCGVRVFIVTHSDLLIYQLNNLIKNSSIINKKRVGYSHLSEKKAKKAKKFVKNIRKENLFIRPKKVSVYSFDNVGIGQFEINGVTVNKEGIDNSILEKEIFSSIEESNFISEIIN